MSTRRAPIAGDEIVIPAPRIPTRDARATYHGLLLGGFTSAEAANLTAHLAGLRISARGWTLQQIEHLLFLRSVVESGRLQR